MSKYKTTEPELTKVTYDIDCGNMDMQYQYGNYINAVEQLSSYFMGKLHCSGDRLAECLELYAKHLREDG